MHETVSDLIPQLLQMPPQRIESGDPTYEVWYTKKWAAITHKPQGWQYDNGGESGEKAEKLWYVTPGRNEESGDWYVAVDS